VKYICGSATVESIYGSATVKYICDSATVKYIYDSATVEELKGQAVMATSQYSEWANRGKLLLLENATLKDNYHKAIYQSGDYKLVSVTDGKVK
jgi:hypothetical protein